VRSTIRATAATRSGELSRTGDDATAWTVRYASQEDVEPVATAVRDLLIELGGQPPPTASMRATVRTLVEDQQAGALLVARSDEGGLVGLLAASWPTAIHAGGSYGLIQDLWVDPMWRGRTVGESLLEALRGIAKAAQVTRVEVGLPRVDFAGIQATTAFYGRNGFEQLGTRMRLVIS